jgi:hypothetical protein
MGARKWLLCYCKGERMWMLGMWWVTLDCERGWFCDLKCSEKLTQEPCEIKVYECGSVRVYVWGCESARVWECEGVKVWECEFMRLKHSRPNIFAPLHTHILSPSHPHTLTTLHLLTFTTYTYTSSHSHTLTPLHPRTITLTQSRTALATYIILILFRAYTILRFVLFRRFIAFFLASNNTNNRNSPNNSKCLSILITCLKAILTQQNLLLKPRWARNAHYSFVVFQIVVSVWLLKSYILIRQCRQNICHSYVFV